MKSSTFLLTLIAASSFVFVLSDSSFAWHPASGDFSWNGRVKPSRPSESQSHGAMMTETYYNFDIINDARNKVIFFINQDRYTLHPGERRSFSYRDRYGTNTGNVRSYDIKVSFDYLYLDGTQEKKYDIRPNKLFRFKDIDGGIDLYNDY